MKIPTAELKVVSSQGLVIVEAAHFYAEGGLDPLALLGAQLAIGLVNEMTGWGARVEHMLFVDDIGCKQREPDISHELASLGAIGYNPTQIVYESSLVVDGESLIGQLVQSDKTKEHSGRLKLKNGFFPIRGKAGNSNSPSCEVLDSVLYIRKLQSAQGAVTILPESYYTQQDKTRKVLQSAGVMTPNVLLVCYDQSGEITKTQYWGN